VARTIEIGASPVDVTFEMADIAIEIDGTVQGSDGKPLSGALVVIVPEDPEHNQNIFRRDQSDTDGTFKLRVVMPGRYTLVAIQDGWDLEWSNIEVMRRFLARGRSIQVLPGQENITATLTAQSAQQ
jgi:protocatechuate 3,4-dioxygenase beta subunit